MLGSGFGRLFMFAALATLYVRDQGKQQARRRKALTGSAEDAAARDGSDRGRHAEQPSQIPPRGWRDVLIRVYREVGEDRILANAAGVTYYILLAMFPGSVFLVSVYGLFADAGTIQQHVNALAAVLPAGAIEVISEQIRRVAGQSGATLSFSSVFGLALALWSANSAMKALFDVLNVAYGEREKRGFFHLNALTLAFTLAAILFILVALAAVVVIPAVLRALALGGVAEALLGIGRWPALLILLAGALAVIYRYGPSREEPKWRWVTWGSGFAAVVWLVASMLFSWYAANFGKFNETYGTLGAGVALMTWIWISAVVILVGAELNAEMEHQTARDSTTGPEKPLGARGAKMADTVGKSTG